MRGLGETSSALTASDGALAQSVVGIDQTFRAAPPALSAIDRSLPGVVALARVLTPSLRASPPIVDRLTATAAQLAAVLAPEERSGLIQSLRSHLRAAAVDPHRVLAPAFPIGKQITDCVQTHLLPILKSTVPDGSLSTGQPVWQEFVHFLPGVAGASGSFDADGPYTRVLLGAGTQHPVGDLRRTAAGQYAAPGWVHRSRARGHSGRATLTPARLPARRPMRQPAAAQPGLGDGRA